MAAGRRELAGVLMAIQKAPKEPMKDPPPELIIEDFERTLAMIKRARESFADANESTIQVRLTALATEYRRLLSDPKYNFRQQEAVDALVAFVESAAFRDPGQRARA